MQWLMIALGGALGAISRAALSGWVTKSIGALGTGFPFGTLAVNFLGSFLMGICAVIILDHFKMPGYWRELVMVGFLGALTTFSTFSLEGLSLIHAGEFMAALTYFLASVIGCVFACFLGWHVARLFV